MELSSFYAVLCLCLLLKEKTEGSSVQVSEDGGYENVLVAVSSQIEVSDPRHYIEGIKDLISLTSDILHQSTRGKFYLKSVTILVPAEWRNRLPDEYKKEASHTQYYRNADIRVENPRPLDGYKLFTQQPRRCGQPGDFIQMSATFLNESQNNLNFAALCLMREWSRLRFGIFEENFVPGDPRFPSTYYSNDVFKVTGCRHPYGWIYNPDASCANKNDQDLCGFTHNVGSYKSSVMDNSSSNILNFCDDGPDHFHNSESPTPQNALCHERSTWDVITSSSDFKAVQNESNYRKPEIRIVQPSSMNLIFVIDPSLCEKNLYMERNTLMISLKKFLKLGLLENTHVGIIFANNVTYLPLQVLHYNDQFVTNVQLSCIAQDWTENDYQASLDLAVENITQSATETRPSVVILIANGTNVNSSQLMSDNFTSKINDKSIDFHLITFSIFATSIQTPSIFSKFTWYNIPSFNTLSFSLVPPSPSPPPEWSLKTRMKLDQIFTSITDKYSSTFSPRKTLIYEELHNKLGEGRVSSKTPGRFYFVVYTYFPFSQKKYPNIYINTTMTELQKHDYAQIITGEIDAQDKLEYRVSYDSETFRPFSVAIWFEAVDNSMSVQGVIEQETGPEKVRPPLLIVYTSVQNPIVRATIEGVNNHKVKTIRLLPAGTHVKSKEKMYSRYFIGLNDEPDLYEVLFTVSDKTDNQSFVLRSNLTFYTSMTKKDVDLSPNRIIDFHVKEINVTEKSVIFAWTAPGKFLDNERVHSYWYQCSLCKSELEDNRNYGTLNNVLPGDPGTPENYKTTLSKFNTTYYCAIKFEGVEGGGGLSDRSNIVTVYVQEQKMITPITTTTLTTRTTVYENMDSTVKDSVASQFDSNLLAAKLDELAAKFDDFKYCSFGLIGFLMFMALMIAIFLCILLKRRLVNVRNHSKTNDSYT